MKRYDSNPFYMALIMTRQGYSRRKTAKITGISERKVRQLKDLTRLLMDCNIDIPVVSNMQELANYVIDNLAFYMAAKNGCRCENVKQLILKFSAMLLRSNGNNGGKPGRESDPTVPHGRLGRESDPTVPHGRLGRESDPTVPHGRPGPDDYRTTNLKKRR